MKDFSESPHPLPFWNFFMFVLLCLHLFFSSLSCCSHSPLPTFLARGKKTSPMKPAPCVYPSTSLLVFVSVSQSMSPFDCLSSQFVVLSGWVNAVLPMWLSSPQGTAQVSRLWWRIQAQSVTNAFGWSARPQGTLFHSSVGTWQQSPQELFKGEKLYQSQPVLLHAHPSPPNHTLKTRWSSLFLSLSLCLVLLVMALPSFACVG